jgi:hypothetical protein
MQRARHRAPCTVVTTDPWVQQHLLSKQNMPCHGERGALSRLEAPSGLVLSLSLWGRTTLLCLERHQTGAPGVTGYLSRTSKPCRQPSRMRSACYPTRRAPLADFKQHSSRNMQLRQPTRTAAAVCVMAGQRTALMTTELTHSGWQ